MIVMLINQIRARQPNVGGRKLHQMLADPAYGLPVNIGRDKLFRLLKERNMQSKLYRRFKKTTNSNHKLPVYPNLIKGMKIQAANQVWVSDITYIRLVPNKFCYLFLVSDLFSRKVLGYAVKPTLSTEGAEEALQMALAYAKPKAGFIHHSDHGVQYCSKNYVTLLERHGAVISMTGPDRCYDNAVAERINGILKQEFGLGATFPNIKAVWLLAVDSINIYNNERLHFSLDLQTPSNIYEESFRAQLKSTKRDVYAT